MHSGGVNLWYFKLRLFDLTYFIVLILRSATEGYKDIVIRKSEFVANTQFLSGSWLCAGVAVAATKVCMFSVICECECERVCVCVYCVNFTLPWLEKFGSVGSRVPGEYFNQTKPKHFQIYNKFNIYNIYLFKIYNIQYISIQDIQFTIYIYSRYIIYNIYLFWIYNIQY